MSPNTPPCFPATRPPRRVAVMTILGLSLLAGCTQTAPVNPFAAMPDSVTTAPVINFKSCPRPEYPRDALAARAEGTVTLAFLVKDDGKSREALVRKTSGNALLDETARAALAKCRFQPGTVNGAPKEQWTEVRYAWKLDAS